MLALFLCGLACNIALAVYPTKAINGAGNLNFVAVYCLSSIHYVCIVICVWVCACFTFLPFFPLVLATDLPQSDKEGKMVVKKKRKIKMEKKRERKEQPNSLPSLRERSEPQGVLDRRVHWESQEIPVGQSHLSTFVCITG